MRLKKLSLNLFVLLLTCSAAVGQNVATDTSATFFGYWQKGETQVLNIKRDRARYQNGVLQSKDESTYGAHLKILDETEESYTIEWTYENIRASSGKNPLVQRLATMTEGLKVIYKTDEFGMLTELVNWQEIQTYLNAVLERMLNDFENQPEIAAAFEQLRGMFATKQSIENTLIREIQLYHFPYGLEYLLGEKLAFEAQLPNVLGGDPFPALLRLELVALQPEENFGKLVMTQQMDEDKSTQIIYETIKQLATRMSKPVPDETELPAIAISDSSEYEIDLHSGWLTRVFYHRTVQSHLMRQVDTYEITLKR